jgi:hypothetical protein
MAVLSANFASSGTTFNKASVGGTWSWTTITKNIPNFGQQFEVSDIKSPFGPISSVNLPIPGDVINAMAESITCLTQQVSSAITVTSPIPTQFALTVTEGAPSEEVGTVVLTNSGAFGSFLTVNATPTVSWLSVTPTQTVGVTQNSSVSFSIVVDPSQLLASESPYNGKVNFASQDDPNTIIEATVTVTVIPQPVLGVTPTSIVFNQTIGMPMPASSLITVSNDGTILSTMDYIVGKAINNSAWLSFTPASGGPLLGGESEAVTLSLNTTQIPALMGTYTETIRVSSPTASNEYVDVTVSLVVMASGGSD